MIVNMKQTSKQISMVSKIKQKRVTLDLIAVMRNIAGIVRYGLCVMVGIWENVKYNIDVNFKN